MYKKIITLICLFCLCFSFKVYAEELFFGDNQTRTDYSAYMNVSIPKDSTGKAMLLFRAKDIELLGYGLSYYEVGFDTGSKIVLRKYYTGYYIAKTVTLDTVKVDNDGSSKNITVEAVGNSFKIYLDGELIIDHTDNGTYDKNFMIIPANLTGDVGYRVDGDDAVIIDYGSTDYEESGSHIESVTITDSDGNVIENGSYIPPETELNYDIDFTESYDGVSIVAVKDGAENLLEADIKKVVSNGRTGKIVSPADKGYFNVVEYAWDSMDRMIPLYAEGNVAEFNLKKIVDFYNRKAISKIEEYKIDKEKYMTGSSTESVNITFSNGEDLIDAAGIVLSSAKESELHGVNCYRAVIRNKNTVSLEKVSDGITTVLGEVSIEPILDGEKHNLKLHIYGSRIKIYYDGEKIIQYIVPDIFYLSGYPGTYQYGKGIEFDNIVLSN